MGVENSSLPLQNNNNVVLQDGAGGSIQIDVRPMANSTATMTLKVGMGGKENGAPGEDTTLKLCDGTVVTASGGGKSVAMFNVKRTDYPDWDKYGKGGAINQSGVDGFGAVNVFSLYVESKNGRTAAKEGFTNTRWGNRLMENMSMNNWVHCPDGICPEYGTLMTMTDKFKGCPYDKVYEENGEKKCAISPSQPPPQTNPPPSSNTKSCWIHCPGGVCPAGISTSLGDRRNGCHPDNLYYENNVELCRCLGPSDSQSAPIKSNTVANPNTTSSFKVNDDNHCWTPCPGGACPPGILRSTVDRLKGCAVGKAYFQDNVQYCDCTKTNLVQQQVSVQECINNTTLGDSGSCDQCVPGFYGDATSSSGCQLPTEDVTIVRIDNVVVGKTSLNQNNATVDGFTVDITLEINARNYLYGMAIMNNSPQTLSESRQPSDTIKSVVTFKNVHITESGLEWTVQYYDTNTSNAAEAIHTYTLKYRATPTTASSIPCKLGDFAVGYILIGGGQAGGNNLPDKCYPCPGNPPICPVGIMPSYNNLGAGCKFGEMNQGTLCNCNPVGGGQAPPPPPPPNNDVQDSMYLTNRVLYDNVQGCIDCPPSGCPAGYVVSADDRYKGFPDGKQVPGGKCRGPPSTWQNCPKPLVGGICASCSAPYPVVGVGENRNKCRSTAGGGGGGDTLNENGCVKCPNGDCPSGYVRSMNNPNLGFSYDLYVSGKVSYDC